MSKKNRKAQAKDTSKVVPQNTMIKEQLTIYERTDLTDRQKEFINLALDKKTKLMFVEGPAGTSKSFLAVYCSLLLLNKRAVSDIVYVRSAVESSDAKLGFLPGEADDKMAPYIQPLLDKLDELLPKQNVEWLVKDKRITGMPVGYLRGLSFNAKAIIADEMQNCTWKELLTLITRTGEFSKLFVLGDESQSDLNGKSGFKKMVEVFSDQESKDQGIISFKFTEEDIVRSALVKFIIKHVKQKNLV